MIHILIGALFGGAFGWWIGRALAADVRRSRAIGSEFWRWN